MASLNSKQMTTGKSFEYALLISFEEKLKDKTNLEVIKNSALDVAKSCFDSVSQNEQSEYLLSASFAVNFLIDIEPRLSNDVSKDDILQLEILSDNHKAVKHSRLSSKINFGEKWLGIKNSKEYFDTINPIFNNLEKIRKASGAKKKWVELGDYHTSIYVPILEAFIKELQNLYKIAPQKVASNLVSYLVGNKDFYKVIKRKNSVEIQAYNLNGTLNLPFQDIQPKYQTPKYQTPKVPLPTEILDIDFKMNSDTTAIVTMNNEWTLSFRIHNASSRVESSLKFDINLLKSPKKLFKNTLNISKD